MGSSFQKKNRSLLAKVTSIGRLAGAHTSNSLLGVLLSAHYVWILRGWTLGYDGVFPIALARRDFSVHPRQERQSLKKKNTEYEVNIMLWDTGPRQCAQLGSRRNKWARTS